MQSRLPPYALLEIAGGYQDLGKGTYGVALYQEKALSNLKIRDS